MSDYWGNEAAGAILFDPASKKFGLARRSAMVNEPGLLGTFGGAMESGDSVQETLDNELMEEIGYFYPADARPLPVFEDKENDFRYHNFVVNLDMSSFDPVLNWENDAIEWYTYAELNSLEASEAHFGLAWLLEQKGTHSALKTIVRNEFPGSSNEPGPG